METQEDKNFIPNCIFLQWEVTAGARREVGLSLQMGASVAAI
jgi:hypothetical protein